MNVHVDQMSVSVYDGDGGGYPAWVELKDDQAGSVVCLSWNAARVLGTALVSASNIAKKQDEKVGGRHDTLRRDNKGGEDLANEIHRLKKIEQLAHSVAQSCSTFSAGTMSTTFDPTKVDEKKLVELAFEVSQGWR